VKFLHFVAYVIYGSISLRAGSPYFRTLCILAFLGFLNLNLILVALGLTDLLPAKIGGGKLQVVVEMALLLMLLWAMISKKKLEEFDQIYGYDWDRIFKYRIMLIIYYLLSFALLMYLAYWKKHQ
jgi:hypothetical protein